MKTLLKNLHRLAALAPISALAISATALAQGTPLSDPETVLAPGTRNGCPTLQLLNVVPLATDNNLLTVPAVVNGKTWSFQFDTAAITEQMTDAAAQRLGLHSATPNSSPQINGNFNEAHAQAATGGGVKPPVQFHDIAGSPLVAPAQIWDSLGRGYSSIATVDDFVMKTMENKGVEFHISPLPPPDVDGVLSLGMFERFDIDLNFSAHQFNLFSKDHCSGEVLYWRAPVASALPFVMRDNRIFTRVMLDGKELTAVIDTGSPISVLRYDAAERLFDLSPGAAGLMPVSDRLANDSHDLSAHGFKMLSFGKIALDKPRILLTRSSILVQGSNPNVRTGSLITSDASSIQPDMIIGVDLLKQTHLYIAMRERVLYVTQGTELAPGDAAMQPVVPVAPFRP